MEEEGITFQCNANVGVNVNINDLLREYNAIVLAGGSTVPRDLKIPGRELKGVYYAMEFLKQQNKRNAGLDPLANAAIESNILSENILATGKNVVVIGGGDTGSDCVGTSNRHAAISVTQFELLPKPPEDRAPHMPWPSYPMVLKTTSSHEEGVERHWAVATKEFIGDGKGNLKALKIVDLEWKASSDGRPASFVERAGSEREIPCEMALLAMGFLYPQQNGLLETLDIEKDDRGNIKTSEKNYQTNLPKIFAAGDARRGQSLVVWAISEGRECARKVDEFLQNSASVLESKDTPLLFKVG
jgi:glutamate synthase (NADPH/NADH) small chain